MTDIPNNATNKPCNNQTIELSLAARSLNLQMLKMPMFQFYEVKLLILSYLIDTHPQKISGTFLQPLVSSLLT